MPRATFSSVVAKLGRAGQHCEALNRAIGFSVSHRDAYSVTFQRDGESPDVLHLGRFIRVPPLAQWGAMFGDAVHAHRSALDHLAWHLTCVNSGTPPPEPIPRNSAWREVAFPIVPNETHWDAQVQQKLWGVDPDLIPTFKALQPHVTHKDDPDRAPLTMLERLWNMDKHRQIHFVDVTIWADDIRLLWHKTNTQIRTRTVAQWAHKWRPETGNASAPLVQHRLLDPLPRARHGEVEVDRTLTADISLPEGPPAFGETLLKLLADQHAAVADVIKAFHASLGGSPADWDEWERVAREVAPPPSIIPTGPPQ